MNPRLFFSWQSDTPNQTNKLRKAIQTALKEVKSRTGVIYEFDEATRDLPGSPDIKQAILAKIEVASIFVADVTSVVETSVSDRRHHSNSNVMFELGYASATLGVERIIQITRPPADSLPFDIRGNRTTVLNDRIAEHLTNAVVAIQKHDPLTPFERRIAEPARRRSERANVEGYFANLPLRMLADSIGRLPQTFDRTLANVFDDLSARRQRPDKNMPSQLQDDFDQLLFGLNKLSQLGADYYLDTAGALVRLPKPHESPRADYARKEATLLKEILEATLDKFVSSARRKFPDVDFDKISLEAEQLYARES